MSDDPGSTTGADEVRALRAEVARLERTVARERARRDEAESIGEQVTTDLYRTVEELRETERALRASAERTRHAQQIVRVARTAPDSARMRAIAAERIGVELGVDRAVVVTLEGGLEGARWTPEGVTTDLTGPPYDDPARVEGQLRLLGPDGPMVVVGDTDVPRPGWPEMAPDSRTQGLRGLIIAPMWAGPDLVGGITLVSIEPREWDEHTLGVVREVAVELGHLLVHMSAREQEERLRHLEELDRTKDAFVSNVSHELRTPLASITGYLELLQEDELGKLPDPAVKALDVVARNAYRLRSLVEDLLTFSAHAAGETRLNQVSVDLVQLVEECCQTLRPWARARGVELLDEPDLDLPKVWADGPQLRRAVHRVVSNAVKFTPTGGRVGVGIARDRDIVRVVVSDTGPGIAPEETEQVFTPFFRASSSVRDEVPGTGLGLPLVKAVVELHGGSVHLDSQQGRGTVVTIELPVGPVPSGD